MYFVVGDTNVARIVDEGGGASTLLRLDNLIEETGVEGCSGNVCAVPTITPESPNEIRSSFLLDNGRITGTKGLVAVCRQADDVGQNGALEIRRYRKEIRDNLAG